MSATPSCWNLGYLVTQLYLTNSRTQEWVPVSSGRGKPPARSPLALDAPPENAPDWPLGGPWMPGEPGRRGHPGAGPHDGAGPRASSAPPLLTEIGRLHRVVEVLGRPRRHAVWASDPWGKGAASCPVRAGPGPRLMSQNVHQSPGRGRGMVSGLGAAGRDGEREGAGLFPLPFSPLRVS